MGDEARARDARTRRRAHAARGSAQERVTATARFAPVPARHREHCECCRAAAAMRAAAIRCRRAETVPRRARQAWRGDGRAGGGSGRLSLGSRGGAAARMRRRERRTGERYQSSKITFELAAVELARRAWDAQLLGGPASTRARATCHLRKRRKGGVVQKALARLLRRPRYVLTRTVSAPRRVRGTRRALELTRGDLRHMRARAGGRKLTVHSKASIAVNRDIPRPGTTSEANFGVRPTAL